MKDIEECKDTKTGNQNTDVRKSMNDREHKGQRKKVKMTNDGLQNITQKTNDREPQYILSFNVNDNIINKSIIQLTY